MKTLYLIHHSHTDIGYTDRQEKISRYHRHYIKEVIRLLDQIEAGDTRWSGYHYTCENYWQVEQFLAHSTAAEREKFEDYVRKGAIDISLTYLNVNDLVDREILQRKLSEAKAYGEQLGVALTSAMTADINGASWGYGEAMAETGIQNFFTNTHTHHGMFPLYQKQLPFWWEMPKGEKILVWSGDHYQIGNDFYLIPNSDQSQQYGVEGYTREEEERQFALTEERVADLFQRLAEEDYPYDFIPQMISGIVTDNAPPNPRMMEGIHRWNQVHGKEVEIKLVTLNQFFRELRQKELSLPTYRGDWPDWWADGVGTTPAATKLYRDGQRKRRLAKKLTIHEEGDVTKLKEAEQALMMYAEHTWSYHSSTAEPWDSNVNELDFRKSAYGANGHRLISDYLDDVLESLGEEPLQMNRQSYFKVINPHETEVCEVSQLYMKHWQTVDDSYYFMATEDFAELVDCQTGEVIPSQTIDTSKGKEVSFVLTLGPKEERLVQLRRVILPKRYPKFLNQAAIAADSIADLVSHQGYCNSVTSHKIDTIYFTLTFDSVKGLVSLWDKQNGRELVNLDALHAPFQGVYEKTPVRTDPCTERRRMGRNRKGRIAERDVARLSFVEVVTDGPISATVKLEYQLAGTQLYTVFYTVYKQIPKISVSVRVQKDNEWAPESLYVPLTFHYGKESDLFIEKAGAAFRPAMDQLPGTNIDFYMHDTGLVYTDGTGGLIVGIKDTPLITLGDLEHHDIDLSNETNQSKNKASVYGWVMNNIWETNFKVDLAGFYEFAFDLVSVRGDQSPEELMVYAHEIDEGIVTIAYNPSDEEIAK